MKTPIARHLRSNLVAYLTIFLAIAGGTAYATHGVPNSISSVDIINGQVLSSDLGTGAVIGPKVADDAVDSPRVADDSIVGADVRESTLLLGNDWIKVGSAPPFNSTSTCKWRNFDGSHNSAAFLRDRSGVVHLKGLVRAVDGPGGPCNLVTFGEDTVIFYLPDGYRPARREVFETIANATLGRVNVEGPAFIFLDGAVGIEGISSVNAHGWVSLDGISFRCGPAGVAGCP